MTSLDDLTRLFGTIGAHLSLQDLRERYDSFGKKDSKYWYRVFCNSVSDQKYTPEIRVMIVACAVIIKNRDRITNELLHNDEIKDKAWVKVAYAYFKDSCVQGALQSDGKKMPVVNIPSCMPTVTALIWKKITPRRTADEFLKQQWACQIHLERTLIDTHKANEINFWKNIVRDKKGNPLNRVFDDKIYELKTLDRAYLPNNDFSKFGMSDSNGGYSRIELDRWLELGD